jgi:hypothetical protein
VINKENEENIRISLVDTEELTFDIDQASIHEGLVIVADIAGGDFLPDITGDFIKWSQESEIDLPVKLLVQKRYIHRRSIDIWLPVMWIGQNVLLPIVLSLIAAYIFDKSKGLLKGEKATVKFALLHRNKKGQIKRFEFEGDSNSLSKLINKSKTLDLDTFFDD